MEKKIGKFDVAHANGRKETLYVFAEKIDSTKFVDGIGLITGIKQLRTVNGDQVDRIAHGKYRIKRTGQLLASSSPDAK